MLKRTRRRLSCKSAQALAEYLMVIGGLIAIFFVFTRPGGEFNNSVNRATAITITTMNVTATEIFSDLGTVN